VSTATRETHPAPARSVFEVNTEVGEPVGELSVFMLPGRVTDPGAGLRQAIDAERAGFGRIWLSERYDLKDPGLLYAAAAVTTRIQVGSGLIAAGAHHPVVLASWAATLQAVFGTRLTVGLGRGMPEVLHSKGLKVLSLPAIEDYAMILRRLWAGETVTYHGPIGNLPNAALLDRVDTPAPPLVLGCLGGSRACAVAARSFDAVFLMPFTTPDATAETKGWLRAGAEQAARDPDAVRVIAEVVTAPDLAPDSDEAAALVHARALTYLQMPGLGKPMLRRNQWDPAHLRAIENHPMFTGGRSADQGFHRSELLAAARMLPPEWIESTAAIGSPSKCVDRLETYFAAGADEIVLHGSAPDALAPVVAEYRRRRTHNTAVRPGR